jgi:hypothetical protein
MGWASGGELADRIWAAVEPWSHGRPKAEIDAFAALLVDAFEEMDCDVLEECDNPIGDVANRQRHERYGAPKDPEVGGEYTDRWKDQYRFDGRRWQCAS